MPTPDRIIELIRPILHNAATPKDVDWHALINAFKECDEQSYEPCKHYILEMYPKTTPVLISPSHHTLYIAVVHESALYGGLRNRGRSWAIESDEFQAQVTQDIKLIHDTLFNLAQSPEDLESTVRFQAQPDEDQISDYWENMRWEFEEYYSNEQDDEDKIEELVSQEMAWRGGDPFSWRHELNIYRTLTITSIDPLAASIFVDAESWLDELSMVLSQNSDGSFSLKQED